MPMVSAAAAAAMFVGRGWLWGVTSVGGEGGQPCKVEVVATVPGRREEVMLSTPIVGGVTCLPHRWWVASQCRELDWR